LALTNIELYEELKKTLTDDAARMIAEVVPKGDDIVTVDVLDRRLLELKSYIDSRMTRFMLAGFIPIWAAMFAMLGVLIAKV
jgi:hypothetical protein